MELQTTYFQSAVESESSSSAYSSPASERTETRIKSVARSIMQMHFLSALLQDPKIRILNTHDFIKWLKITAPLIEKGLQDPLIKISIQTHIFFLLAHRIDSQKESIPIFHSFGYMENGKIKIHPRYDWVSPESHPDFVGLDAKNLDLYPQSAVRRSCLFRALYQLQTTYSLATQENLYRAFIYLRERKELAWEHTIGMCYARATASIEHLLSLGFQKERLFTALIVGNDIKFDTGEFLLTWRFHIAAGMELEDGSQYILDPSTVPDGPTDIATWEYQNRFNRKKTTRPLTILDRREAAIPSQELAALEKKKSNTVILLPPHATCWNPGPGFPLTVTRSTPKDDIISHLDNCSAFEKITLEKGTIQILEASFSHTPYLLDILAGRQILPDLPRDLERFLQTSDD